MNSFILYPRRFNYLYIYLHVLFYAGGFLLHSLVDAVMSLKATRTHKLQKIADLQSQIINREKKKDKKKNQRNKNQRK